MIVIEDQFAGHRVERDSWACRRRQCKSRELTLPTSPRSDGVGQRPDCVAGLRPHWLAEVVGLEVRRETGKE
jgi:hypothetical protein